MIGVNNVLPFITFTGHKPNKRVIKRMCIWYDQTLETKRHELVIQNLEANLERRRDDNEKLRSELALSQKDLESTRSKLDREQEKTRRLESYIEKLEKERNERPPPLRVTIDASKAPSQFVVLVSNRSQSQMRVIQHQG
jgi:chromosome segregation ATPase